jgi:hypothetical protein
MVKGNTRSRTSVVLLLLVVVAELPLTLCCHSTLRLHHLFCLIWTTLEPLSGVEALNVGGWVHTCIKVTQRVVALRYSTHHSGIFDII